MFGDFTKDIFRVSKSTIAISLLVSLTPWVVLAQEKTDESSAELSRRVTELSALVQKLQARIDEIEGRLPGSIQPAASASSAAAPAQPAASRREIRWRQGRESCFGAYRSSVGSFSTLRILLAWQCNCRPDGVQTNVLAAATASSIAFRLSASTCSGLFCNVP